jgi:hypothetical protein
MRAFQLSGMTFERLTVIRRDPSVYGAGTKSKWICQCICGSTVSVIGRDLVRRNTRSCGCLRAEIQRTLPRKHGLSKHPLYAKWAEMIRRCHAPQCHTFPSYGGRGIRVCSRWRESLQSFIDDMGLPPSRQHSIDRINNDGDYEPGNCRWATSSQQGRNTRANRTLTLDGEAHCISEWSEITGLQRSCIGSRLRRGWSVRRTLTTPQIVTNGGVFAQKK